MSKNKTPKKEELLRINELQQQEIELLQKQIKELQLQRKHDIACCKKFKRENDELQKQLDEKNSNCNLAIIENEKIIDAEFKIVEEKKQKKSIFDMNSTEKKDAMRTFAQQVLFAKQKQFWPFIIW